MEQFRVKTRILETEGRSTLPASSPHAQWRMCVTANSSLVRRVKEDFEYHLL
jgi:hypothetical protein